MTKNLVLVQSFEPSVLGSTINDGTETSEKTVVVSGTSDERSIRLKEQQNSCVVHVWTYKISSMI